MQGFRRWLHDVRQAVSSVVLGMKTTARAMFKTYDRGAFTEVYEYPEVPVPVKVRYRGFHRNDLTACIGCDKCGPGPGTESNVLFPDELGPFETSHMYKRDPDPRSMPKGFNWTGFRPEHRLSDEHRIEGFDHFTDWPNLTLKLAERGFNEEELRKLLGLNYLRVFNDILG